MLEYKLNFNTDVFKHPYNKKYNLREIHCRLNLDDVITENFKNLLLEKNIIVSLIEHFYSPPNYKQIIHIDQNFLGDYVKINYVYGGENSVMKWYNVKENSKLNFKISKVNVSANFISYNDDDVEKIYETNIKKYFSLLQVGVPHNVVNSEEERFCISMVIRDKTTYERLNIKESLTRLKEYII